MAKLSQAALNRIKSESERLAYGKITIVINETMPDVDIVVEERVKFAKDIPPAPGKIAVKRNIPHQG